MIVRDVLSNPELLNNFDWFNDTDDTINWLLGAGSEHAELISKLKTGQTTYITKRNKEFQDRYHGTIEHSSET